jgi:hypothetical protein
MARTLLRAWFLVSSSIQFALRTNDMKAARTSDIISPTCHELLTYCKLCCFSYATNSMVIVARLVKIFPAFMNYECSLQCFTILNIFKREWIIVEAFKYFCESVDRLCGLVVRVSGYRSRDPGFDSRCFQIFWEAVGLELGPLSLLRTTEELLGRNSSDSGQENRD